MKYCVEYYRNFRYNNIIDEVIFNYNTYKDDLLKEINKQKWKNNQRIIVRCKCSIIESIIPILRMCQKQHNNFAVLLENDENISLDTLNKYEIKFFYNNYVKTIDEVYGLIKKGVSDIYITESLAFNLKEVSSYCKDKNVNVRIIPNIAQYTIGYRNEIPDAYKFFIRPEDTEYYEPLVNVFEIISPDNRLSVLYEIYRNKRWIGDLNQLIVGLNEPFYNSGVVPFFGEKRIDCKQRCMREKCTLCQQMKDLSEKLYNNSLQINKTTDKEWKNETRSHKEAMQFIKETTSISDAEIPEK